jgi:hypothetical protein
MNDSVDKKEYAPWERDKTTAYQVIIFALAIGSLIFFKILPPLIALAIIVPSVSYATYLLKRAKNREFGKNFEIIHGNQLANVLISAGIDHVQNKRFHGGDIDMLVNYQNVSIPIEIKSFIKWNQFFYTGGREKKAYNQTEKQITAVQGSYGFIWLPQGKPTFFQRLFGSLTRNKRVKVIFGDANALLKELKRFSI